MSSTTIAIIGGGCSGTMIAAQQMLKIMEHQTILNWASSSEHKINFKIYDKDGSAGRGEPYAKDEDGIFLLNQPVYAMSPLPQHPEHFGSWLTNNNYPYNQDDFVPRGIYGQYLQEVFMKASHVYQSLGCGKVDLVRSHIMNVIPSGKNSYTLVSDDYNIDGANIIVLASGHSRSDLLLEYSHHSHYFSAPYDKDRAKAALKNSKDAAMIIGTSQSMLDSLALLNHIKFTNPIYAISRRLVKPWLFDAKAHRENKDTYVYQYLTPQALAQQTELSFQDIEKLFNADINNGLKQGFPLGHLISRLNPYELEQSADNWFTKNNFEKFVSHVRALYGNPTSPERYNLMQEYEKSGQLRFVQADITQASILENNNGFNVSLKGHEDLNISALFNSSSYSMKAIADNQYVASPLLRRLDQRKALKRHEQDHNAFAFGEQNWNNLYLAGPSCNSQRWGVETFRDSLTCIAESSVQKIKQGIIAAP